MSKETYRQLFDAAKKHIKQDKSVILDATFSRQNYRAKLQAALKSHHVNIYFIEASAPVTVLRKHLNKREHKNEVISDARLEDFEKLYQQYESPEEIDRNRRIRIDTNDAPEETLKKLFERLMENNLIH